MSSDMIRHVRSLGQPWLRYDAVLVRLSRRGHTTPILGGLAVRDPALRDGPLESHTLQIWSFGLKSARDRALAWKLGIGSQVVGTRRHALPYAALAYSGSLLRWGDIMGQGFDSM